MIKELQLKKQQQQYFFYYYYYNKYLNCLNLLKTKRNKFLMEKNNSNTIIALSYLQSLFCPSYWSLINFLFSILNAGLIQKIASILERRFKDHLGTMQGQVVRSWVKITKG